MLASSAGSAANGRGPKICATYARGRRLGGHVSGVSAAGGAGGHQEGALPKRLFSGGDVRDEARCAIADQIFDGVGLILGFVAKGIDTPL